MTTKHRFHVYLFTLLFVRNVGQLGLGQMVGDQQLRNGTHGMFNCGIIQSGPYEWETPQKLFDDLDAKFHFNLDVCASPENAKCAKYFTKEQDGLVQKWRGSCWMNPPYGREIVRWISRAISEASSAEAEGDFASVIVCLLPARVDTSWWHDLVMPHATKIEFIRGRIKFLGSDKKVTYNAPFPSAIVIFGGIALEETG